MPDSSRHGGAHMDDRQMSALALDPQHSVVVSACAGSGKTWLLVSRIIRALLAGAAPSEILAITFPRKGAQELQARLNTWLEILASADDETVRTFLLERGVAAADLGVALSKTRRLFETTLNSRPPITIETFHTWFLQLLQRAPLKSGLAGKLTLLTETSSLMDEAWQRFAQELNDAPDAAAAQSLNALLRDYGLHNTRLLLQHFLSKRGEWWAYTRGEADPIAAALGRLQTELQIQPERGILEEMFAQQDLIADLERFAELLEKNQTSTDLSHAALLRMCFAEADPSLRFKQICGAFFTQAGSRFVRASTGARLKRLGEFDAEYTRLHEAICARLEIARDTLIEQQAWMFNRHALVCGVALLNHFQTLKTNRGVVDFIDIEYGAERLVGDSEHASYMQYKLDARYRHILLDEFQDTNPVQWQMLQHWFDAAIAAGRAPKVFVVGDPKQSIYRFRGADARIFDLAQAYLQDTLGARSLTLDSSRRSAQGVLDAVNQVFGAIDYPHFLTHHAVHQHLNGGVWCRPLPAPIAQPEGSSVLRDPLTTPLLEPVEAAQRAEAEQIAAQLQAIVGQWRISDQGRERRADYGDILLLTRSRTHLRVYEEALSDAGIPFMTARQGGLLESLEARDLIALLEFLILPAANLELAHVLRTPIFDLDDATLLKLARAGLANWWLALSTLAQQDPDPTLQRAHRLLSSWRAQMDYLPVHDLLDRIFHEGEVLPRYAALTPPALSASVQANLLSFLEMALSLDSGRYPSLPKFVDEMRRLRQARDEEAPDLAATAEAANAVRILTVHGAKGLEAPIVWLFDTHRVLPARDSYQSLIDWPPGAPAPTHFSLTSTRKARGQARAPYFERDAAWAAHEELNLLYVAMTRARQYLIVSGAAAAKEIKESWYAKIAAAVPPCADFTAAPSDPNAEKQDAEGVTNTRDDADLERAPVPSPPPTGHGQRLTPVTSTAAQHGIRFHRLLGRLAPPALPVTALSLQQELHLSSQHCADLWAAAHAMMQAPQLARFFDPTQYQRAWNELPFITERGELRRMDRVVAFDHEVWILDYKSELKVSADDVHLAAQKHLPQLSSYLQALRSVFPDKTLRAGLVFRDGLWWPLPASD